MTTAPIYASPLITPRTSLPIPVNTEWTATWFKHDVKASCVFSLLALRALWDGKWHVFSTAQLARTCHISNGSARVVMKNLVHKYGVLDEFAVSGPVKAYRLHSDDPERPARRPSILKGNPRPVIPDHIRRLVFERDEHQCLACGADQNLSLDHIFPWSLGGEDTLNNLQTLCRRCNSKKGAKTWAS